MELLQIDQQHFIRISDVQSVFNMSIDDFNTRLDQYVYGNKPLERSQCQNVDYLSCKSACHFIEWHCDRSYRVLPAIFSFKHSLMQYRKKIPKRVLSRSMRIEIAYRQRYACRQCALFPIPPTFEVDHIVELQDGGRDIASNLQALCSQCHRNKTRLNRLRKHKLFKAEAEHPNFGQPSPQAAEAEHPNVGQPSPQAAQAEHPNVGQASPQAVQAEHPNVGQASPQAVQVVQAFSKYFSKS